MLIAAGLPIEIDLASGTSVDCFFICITRTVNLDWQESEAVDPSYRLRALGSLVFRVAESDGNRRPAPVEATWSDLPLVRSTLAVWSAARQETCRMPPMISRQQHVHLVTCPQARETVLRPNLRQESAIYQSKTISSLSTSLRSGGPDHLERIVRRLVCTVKGTTPGGSDV